MALDLLEELASVLTAFEAAGIEYALCGGLALAVHGHPRFTQDIDLLIQNDQLPAALQVARDVGFDIPARKMTFGLRTKTPRDMQRVSKIDPDTGRLLPLDLMIVAFEFEEVWKGRIRVAWSDRKITVVSREGLAIMKRLAGRPNDLRDLDALEGIDSDPQDES